MDNEEESKNEDSEQRYKKDENEKWDRNSNMPPRMMKRWFGGGPNTDKEVTELFKQELMDLGQGKLNHWQADKDGRLATIILCD